MTEEPTHSQVASGTSRTGDEQTPITLTNLKVSHNGVAVTPSGDFERRVLGLLADTEIFTATPSRVADEPKTSLIKARLRVETTFDQHAGEKAWKGFVIGASLFSLTTALPLHYDYASTMTLETERWDGQKRTYQATGKGTLHYHLFAATPTLSSEIQDHVTEVCLNSLMAQVSQDASFYTPTATQLLTRRTKTIP
jgi:hypothetical protein